MDANKLRILYGISYLPFISVHSRVLAVSFSFFFEFFVPSWFNYLSYH